jgi:Beta-galactosidase
MVIGTAYYPEHWEKSLWEEDILRMKEHGITMLRIGDFAWSKYEYKEEEFTIDYFDSFLELCTKHSMEVIFCTPTAAPPVWLTHKYPEVLNYDIEGNAYYGPRRHYNYNSEIYRRFCERIVEKLAMHYCKWDIIVGWQIDNEISNDLGEFYSESDHKAYKEYLKKKFNTLECLNESMGLTFWSRTYSDWEQVTLNRKNAGGAINPHLALEEKRFFSESAISFCEMQVKVLKKYLPNGKFVTTNGLFSPIDNNRLMESGLDFITYDSYPNFAFDLSENTEQISNLKDRSWSKNMMWSRSISPVYGIMEQQAGANGWTSRMETPMPKPGQMKLWTMQSVAHGADMISYFRWRTSPIGCEIYWHGLNDYCNMDNRRLKELKEISHDIKNLEEVRGAVYKGELAILKDSSNTWDAQVDCWHKRVDNYSDNSWFEAVQLTHTPCDYKYISSETKVEELLQYKMLVYPHPAIIEQATSDLLEQYVNNGGILILGARTGYKDEFGRCPMRPMPGVVSEWCGVTVSDYTLVGPEDEGVGIEWNGKRISVPVFNEVLMVTSDDTEVLANFSGSYYDDKPALCRRAVGNGVVYYLGSCFSVEMAKEFLEITGYKSPYKTVLELPEDTEMAVRSNEEYDFLFVLNYKKEKLDIRLGQPLLELISGEKWDGQRTLPCYDVRVFRLDRK